MSPQRSLRLELEIPPSVNSLYAVGPCPRCRAQGARQIKSQEGRAFTLTYAGRADPPHMGLVEIWAREAGFVAKPKTPYTLTGVVFLKDKRSDMANRLKALIDAICDGVGIDDRYIAELHFVTAYDKADPRVEVLLEELEDWPEPYAHMKSDQGRSGFGNIARRYMTILAYLGIPC